jgi:hypothetical protein
VLVSTDHSKAPGLVITTEHEPTALTVSRDRSVTPPIDPDSPEFERTATHMAREFSEATTEIARLIGELRAQTNRLDAAFGADSYSRFGVDLHFDGRRHDLDDKGVSALVKMMERRAWNVLVDELGIKNVMSVAKRKVFDAQLESGELPPVSEQTIFTILLGFTGQAKDFATEAAREVFDLLRPRRGGYATNNAFRVGRRVILTNRVEQKYGPGWRVAYHYEQEMTAIDGVFHLLDGKGVMRNNKGPLVSAIDDTDASGRGETAYFRFRCYKNRNLHIEFKNLDLVKQLNGLAAGEYVLGEDVE